MRVLVVVAGATLSGVLLLTGCTTDAPSTGDPHRPSDSPAGSSAPPSPGTHVSRRVVVPLAAPAMPGSWHEVFSVPYGPGVERLGISRGGEAGTARYGPESGAPGPDGTWWFLDVAKRRLAHYDSTGHFLGAVRVPERLLVSGRYFQWQLPHVLADGTLLAFRLAAGGGGMLRLRDGVLDEVPLTAMFSPTYDDGRLLYGVVGRSQVATLDPETGVVASVPSYLLPSGAAFSLTDDFDAGVLRVGTAAVSTRLTAVTSSGAIAHVGVQVRAGADDSVHLLLTGYGDDGLAGQLVGYTRISPSGEVTAPERLLNPFSEADRGSPSELVMVPGESVPMLVLVRTDGVHVYRRTG